MIFDRAIRNITNESTNEESKTMSLENPSDWVVGTNTGGFSQSGAMKLSAVNACVECITNSISKLPVYVMDSKTKERINHPLLK
ncbi:MAG: hypothetical protein K0R90_1352, partial [Oscillospiraceae bacterium]|nr:hypothetical protein [Oscillospiraceae bacterium]